MPSGTERYSRASRRLRQILLICLFVVGSLLASAGPGRFALAQGTVSGTGSEPVPGGVDLLRLRTGEQLSDWVVLVDATTVRLTSRAIPRSDLDAIGFGAVQIPPLPEPGSLDVVLLRGGQELRGRVTALDRTRMLLDDGTLRTVPFPELVAVGFCRSFCSSPPSSSSARSSVPVAVITPSPTLPTSTFPVPLTSFPAPAQSPTVGNVTLQTGSTTATPGLPDFCRGDEAISFSPQEPRAGQELLVAVTSAGPHSYPRLTGTEQPTFSRARPGQLGNVWEWTVPLTWPGDQEYIFYADSTVPCVSAKIEVRRPLATPTPRLPRF